MRAAARALLLAGAVAGGWPGPARGELADFQRGMSYAHVVHPTRGYGSDVGRRSLERLQSLHVGWVSLTPFGFARSDTEPTVHTIAEAGMGYAQVGETDARVVGAAEHAHALGMKVLLKPHIWITPRGGSWRGSIHFDDPADWDSWFAAYEVFLLHYARLAQKHGMEGLCIGTELVTATRARPGRWRELIVKVRAVYDGALTYAAHFDGEVEQIAFWDALDYIGVNAYFPLLNTEGATVAELEAAWAPHVSALRAFAERWQRPIVFTEIGYRSSADAAIHPGLWKSDAPSSAMTQARAYEAVFRAFAGETWFRGLYWWKWQSDDDRAGGLNDVAFTPQHKPAEFVVRTYYGRLAAEPAPASTGAE